MFDKMMEHPIGRRLRPVAILGVGAFYLQTMSNCLLFGGSDRQVARVVDQWFECSSGVSNGLYGVAGHSDGSVVAVGAGGTVLESFIEPTVRDMDAAAACGEWADISPMTSVTLRGAWMPDNTTVWTAGGDGETGTGRVLRYDGDEWSNRDGPAFVTYNRIWGSSDCDMYFLGGGIATDLPNGAYFDCGLMSTLTVDIGWSEITDVSGTSSEDIWVVMNQPTYNVWHYNGVEWENHWQEWMDEPLFGVYALSASEVVAVGANGAVYWFIDGEWEDTSPPGVDTDLYDVWGWRSNTIVGPARTVYAVGENGSVYMTGDSPAARSVVSTGASLRAIWGRVQFLPAADIRSDEGIDLRATIYVVGDDGAMWVYRKLTENLPSPT